MLKTLIDTLCNEPRESEWLEFKTNKHEPQLIGEYLSSLSNSACLHDKKYGYLVYGIEDTTHQIVGTSFEPATTRGCGNEALEPWLSRLLSPRVDFRIFEYPYEDKKVVIFRVDATINTPVRFKGQAYIRVGEHKHKLSEHPEKERKIWNKIPLTPFEEGITLSGQSADDVLSKIDYPSFFELLNVPLPDNRSGILSKLLEEKVILETENRFNITNLGGILFAKNFEQLPSLKRKAVRVIIYSGDDRLTATKEQVGNKGYAVGFEGLIDWISDQLPSNELIEDALRVEKKMYPKVAIREFVANAIIHQDFSVTGAGPMIEIFTNRIEISNPGESLVEPDRFIDHAPRSRNEALASLMRRMNICEERGSGVDRAITAIEKFQLPAPEFYSETEFTRIMLFAYKELRGMDRKDKIRACYQHSCLRWLCRDFMTNSSLRKRFGIPDQNYSIASRIIKDSIEEGLIKVADPENTSNKRKYVPFWA